MIHISGARATDGLARFTDTTGDLLVEENISRYDAPQVLEVSRPPSVQFPLRTLWDDGLLCLEQTGGGFLFCRD